MKTNQMIRKAMTFFAAVALTATASACKSDSAAPASSGGDAPIEVGIVQMADNGAFTDMREGFIGRMRELGYTEDRMTFDYRNAQGDMTNLNSIAQELVNGGYDCIVAIATPAAQAVVNLEGEAPVFFISVSNPVGAGIISELEKPDKNATGTSNAIPVEEMFKLSDRLTPGCKTYGLLYNTSEVNSVTTAEAAKAYLSANGMDYREAIVTASSEVQQAAQSLVGQVDAIFIPNDAMVQSALPQVAEVAKDAKIPVYGSSAVMVASGAFATVSIDDPTIGAMTADMADQYLKGTPVAEIPSVVVSTFTTVINQTTAAAIGVELAQEELSAAVILE